METATWMSIVLFLPFVNSGFWTSRTNYGNYNRYISRKSCSCEWLLGGKCKTECSTGEYTFGTYPCDEGQRGRCCVGSLPCQSYGGLCKNGGCDPINEVPYTFKVHCEIPSQTCCLWRAELGGTETSLPITTTPHPATTTPTTNGNCGSRRGRRLYGRILGGLPVQSSCEWPWMVSIKRRMPPSSDFHVCAGVLVSDNKVVTTAGCVKGADIVVTLQENDINVNNEAGEIAITVSRAPDIHYGFNTEGRQSIFPNDVAIITLDTPVPTSTCATPVCLPQQSQSPTPTSRCFIAGWGQNSFFSVGDGLLHAADVNVFPYEQCARAMSNKGVIIPSDKLCSSPNVDLSSACPGDNGGMLVCSGTVGGRETWFLHGLISDNACNSGLPVIYTNILSHLSWIRARI